MQTLPIRRAARASVLASAVLLIACIGPARAQGSTDVSAAAPVRGLVTPQELWDAWLRDWGVDDIDPAPRRPTSRADSLAWARAKRAAERASGRRVVISLFDRRLWLVDGADTLLSAPAGIGMGVVTVKGRTWDFSTPRGRRRVLAKETDPVWIPPDWAYTGMALARDRKLVPLREGREFPLSDGNRVTLRKGRAGLVRPDGSFEPIEGYDAIMFDDTLFVPPLGSANRRVPGMLGKFKLDMGDGLLIHGTQEAYSVGLPATHGCIRLRAEDLRKLYSLAPVGTEVYIY